MNPISRINSMTTAGTADIKDKSNGKRKSTLTDAETHSLTHIQNVVLVGNAVIVYSLLWMVSYNRL